MLPLIQSRETFCELARQCRAQANSAVDNDTRTVFFDLARTYAGAALQMRPMVQAVPDGWGPWHSLGSRCEAIAIRVQITSCTAALRRSRELVQVSRSMVASSRAASARSAELLRRTSGEVGMARAAEQPAALRQALCA